MSLLHKYKRMLGGIELPKLLIAASVFLLSFCLVYPIHSFAQTTYYSRINGNWSNPNTWSIVECDGASAGAIPTATDDVVICDGHNITLNQDATIRHITINIGGELNNNGRRLYVTGNYTVNGVHSGTGRIELQGVNTTIDGTGTISFSSDRFMMMTGNKTILATANLDKPVRNVEVSDNITVTNQGTFAVGGDLKDMNGGETWINDTNATLKVGDKLFNQTGTGVLDADAPGNTVEYNGTVDQTIKIPAASIYHHLTLSGSGAKEINAAIIANGNITINSGTFDSKGFQVNVRGNWTDNGTFLEVAGLVVFDGSADQSISGTAGEQFYDLTNQSGGTLNINADVIVANTFTMAGGNINTSANKLTLGTACGSYGALSYTSGAIIGQFERWFNNNVNPTPPVLFPVGTAGYYRPLELTLNGLQTCGSLISEFVETNPGNNGLPINDGGVNVYNTFVEGYWSLTTANGFNLGGVNNYNLDLTGNGFTSFTINASTRLLRRNSAANPWTVQGVHVNAVGNTAQRDNIGTLSAQYALGDTTNCSGPDAPTVSGPTDVCTGDLSVLYTANASVIGADSIAWIITGGTIASLDGNNEDTVYVNWGITGQVGNVRAIAYNSCSNSAPTDYAANIHSIAPSSISGNTDVADSAKSEPYSVTNQAGYYYRWSVTNGVITAGQGTNSITVDWGSPPSGQVCVKAVYTTLGCDTASQVCLTVNIYNVINSEQTGNWNQNATWDCGCVPTPSSSVRILSGHTVKLLSAETVRNFVIDNGGTLDDNNRAFTVTNDITINGNYTGVQDLTLSGSGSSISGSGTINNRKMRITGGNKTITSGSNLTKTGTGIIDILDDFTITNQGAFTTTVNIEGNSTSTIWLNDVNSTLNVGAAFQTITLSASANGNLVNYNGTANQTIVVPQSSYYHLTASGAATKSLAGAIDVNGDLTISSTLDAVTNAYSINLAGNWNNTGTFVHQNNTVIFDGAANQTIISTGGETFYNLTINKGGGTLTLNDNATTANELTMTSGDVVATTDTLKLGISCAAPGTLTHTTGIVIGIFERWIAATGNYLFPVGITGSYRPSIVNVTALGACGSLTGEFIDTDPGKNGLPLSEASLTPDSVRNVFFEGYWQHVNRNSFSATFDLNLVGTGFTSFTMNASTRILRRPNAATAWSLEGTHRNAVPDTAKRDVLTTLPSQYALGDTTDCDSPDKPGLNGRDSVCVSEAGVKYYATYTTLNTYTPTDNFGSYFNGPPLYDLAYINDGNLTDGTMWGSSAPDTVVLTMTFASPVIIDSVRLRAGQFDGDLNRPAELQLLRGDKNGNLLLTINPVPYTMTAYTFSNISKSATYTWLVINPGGQDYLSIREIEMLTSKPILNWTVTGGSIFTTWGDSISVNWGPVAGAGTVSLTASNSCSRSLDTTLTVTIHTVPPSSINGNITVAENTNEVYSVTAQPGYSYTWTVSGGTILSGQGTDSITVQWGNAGPGNVRVEASSGCGTADPVDLPVNIYGVIISIATGNWNAGGTWDCGCVPQPADNAIIDTGHIVTLTANHTIRNITVRWDGELANGNNFFYVDGNYTIHGTHSGTGRVFLQGVNTNIDGIGAITFSSATRYYITTGNKTILSSTNLSLTAANLSIQDNVQVTNKGTFTVYNNILDITGGETWVNDTNAVLNIGGEFFEQSGTGMLNASAPGNTMNYNGNVAQNIKTPVTSYYHLRVDSSNTKTLTGNVDINGNLIMNSTAQLDVSVNNYTINLAGNWDNLTLSDRFTERTGRVVFDGPGNQTINPNSIFDATFSKLAINKPSGQVVPATSVDLIIADSLIFIKGIIRADSNGVIVLFTDNAFSNGGDADSYVDGLVRKVGNDVFIFPVGDSTIWARIAITNPALTTDAFTAQYFASKHTDANNTDITLNNSSVVEYWTLDRSAGTSDVWVTLYWEDSARSGIDDAVTTDLVVARYNGTNWIDEGQSAITNNDPGDVTSNLVTLFSPFTFASKGSPQNPLPIDLLYFDAILDKEKGKVDLIWATASETNNDYFTVEKSIDGVDFEFVTYIAGAGNSSHKLYYTAIDDDPYYGVSYYRLKQTDYDGKYEYSNIVAVNYLIEEKHSIAVYPNPTDGKFYININGMKDAEVLVIVLDILGKEHYSKVIILDEGEYILAVDPYDKLPHGIYIITATSKNNLYWKRIVISP